MVGQPVKLCPFQQAIVRGIYDSPTRRAIVSFARKNAKTTLAALLLVLHTVGPEAKANAQLYSAAQSKDQAAIVFALAAKVIRLSPELSAYVVVRDTVKELYCSELGTRYRALSAETSTAFGLSPALIIHDELGQVSGPRSTMYEALETATAAQGDPLSIIISTQAPTDADLLSVLIDDAQAGGDPLVKCFLYTADPEADPFAVETIRQANPAFDHFQNQAEVLAMAEAARRMPSREAEFRNLILNQRVERVSPLIAVSVWKANGGESSTDWSDGPVYGGLDLSSTTDLTACVWVAERDGIWHIKPLFWLPEQGLRERARQDRVPYDVWHEQGFLLTTPGKSVAYEYVAQELLTMLETMDVRKVGFDRWNLKHFTPWLVKAGFAEDRITETFVEFGQGFKDMTPAVRTLETALLNSTLRHGNHPVLTMCAANAVVKRDEADGRKLDKLKSRGRIDGIVALAMALSVASEGVASLGFVDEPLVAL
jgi:phage terminase large subunit-like protein